MQQVAKNDRFTREVYVKVDKFGKMLDLTAKVALKPQAMVDFHNHALRGQTLDRLAEQLRRQLEQWHSD